MECENGYNAETGAFCTETIGEDPYARTEEAWRDSQRFFLDSFFNFNQQLLAAQQREQPPLPAPSLFDVSKVAQCASDQLGLSDLFAVGAIVAGQPIPGTKPFVTAGSSRGTSLAGMAADRVFGGARFPVRVPTMVGGPGTGRAFAIAGTKSEARFAGRAVPVVGWGMLAYDVASIAVCSARRVCLLATR